MFILSKIEHTLRLDPSLLNNRTLAEAIKAELENLFLDKIIANLGLVISVYDIQSIDGGFIFPGDGFPTYSVNFRLIMFRPFVGEVISAKLLESTADGLVLSIGFFDDIKIPQALLPHPCVPKPDPVNKNVVHWSWEFGGVSYPIDGVEEIKFKVHDLSFPPLPREQREDDKPFAPMVVIGNLDADGLGPSSWWERDEEEDDDDGLGALPAAEEEEDDDDGPGALPAAMSTDPPLLHNPFGSKEGRRQHATLYMDEHGEADKSLALTWLAVHGLESICIVTKDEDLMRLVCDLGQTHIADHFLPRFWNAIVSKVEGLSENMVKKIPFHAVEIYKKGVQTQGSAENANRSLRREIKNQFEKEFTDRQTFKTTVLCSQKLFSQKLKAHEIRVFAWNLNKDTGAELDWKCIDDLLSEIEADLPKRTKRD